MQRYRGIESVRFGGAALPLPVSASLSRQAAPLPAGGDGDAYTTDVRLGRPTLTATVRLRGTAAAEALELGQAAALSITVAPAASGQAGRTLSLAGAVLAGIDLRYTQAGMAEAELRFVAEAVAGTVDPFSAEDAP